MTEVRGHDMHLSNCFLPFKRLKFVRTNTQLVTPALFGMTVVEFRQKC
jgi:hypothetical protein